MPNMVKIGLRAWTGPIPRLSPHLGNLYWSLPSITL